MIPPVHVPVDPFADIHPGIERKHEVEMFGQVGGNALEYSRDDRLLLEPEELPLERLADDPLRGVKKGKRKLLRDDDGTGGCQHPVRGSLKKLVGKHVEEVLPGELSYRFGRPFPGREREFPEPGRGRHRGGIFDFRNFRDEGLRQEVWRGGLRRHAGGVLRVLHHLESQVVPVAERIHVPFVVHPDVKKERACEPGRQTDQVYEERGLESPEVPVDDKEVMS